MALPQVQLLRRKAKKNKARAEKARYIQQGPQLRYIARWPIIFSYAPFHSREDYTLQYVMVVRQCPNGLYAVGIFLIDTLCLGVKDCFMRTVTPYQFIDLLEKIEEIMPMDSVPPSYVATFVHKAVDYAKSLGFDPRGDYQVVKEFLKDVSLDLSLVFTFGEKGEPVYVREPHDSQEFANTVLEKLNSTVGEGRYQVITPSRGEA